MVENDANLLLQLLKNSDKIIKLLEQISAKLDQLDQDVVQSGY
jgi:hypothetical protein